MSNKKPTVRRGDGNSWDQSQFRGLAIGAERRSKQCSNNDRRHCLIASIGSTAMRKTRDRILHPRRGREAKTSLSQWIQQTPRDRSFHTFCHKSNKTISREGQQNELMLELKSRINSATDSIYRNNRKSLKPKNLSSRSSTP